MVFGREFDRFLFYWSSVFDIRVVESCSEEVALNAGRAALNGGVSVVLRLSSPLCSLKECVY